MQSPLFGAIRPRLRRWLPAIVYLHALLASLFMFGWMLMYAFGHSLSEGWPSSHKLDIRIVPLAHIVGSSSLTRLHQRV